MKPRTPFAIAIALYSAGLCSVDLGAQHAALVPPPPEPRENPTTPAKVRLGQALFWDEQLSSTRAVACGTCHAMTAGGGDPRTADSLNPGFDGVFGTPDDVHGSPGIVAQDGNGLFRREAPFPLREQVTGRKAPTVLMAAYYWRQFWDGRAESYHTEPTTNATLIEFDGSLEAQAAGPPLSEVEMAHRGEDWNGVALRIANARPLALSPKVPFDLEVWMGNLDYPMLFEKAFGSPGVTPLRIQMAIASYQRSLIPDQAPIDEFLAGNHDAMTQQERLGFDVFAKQAHCGLCHSAPLFFRQDFFNIGLRPSHEDTGRFQVTQDPRDMGAFKVPTLRNIELRAPYFHDGSKATLEDVVDFYARGGDFHADRSNLVQPFTIDAAERAALLAFLRRPLTDPRVPARRGPFDHPRLWSQGAFVPKPYGAGSSPGLLEPRLSAVEPPVLGSQHFTFAIDQAPPGSSAWMVFDVASGQQTLFGMPLLIEGTPQLMEIFIGQLNDTGTGIGWKSANLPLPNDPTLAGQTFFMQGLMVAPVFVLSTTNGVAITMFASR